MLNEERREELAARLRLVHFDGEGCGTYGVNACSICCGPSPMSARDVADTLAPLIVGWLDEAWEQGARNGSRGLLPQAKRDKRNPYRRSDDAAE